MSELDAVATDLAPTGTLRAAINAELDLFARELALGERHARRCR